MAVRSEGQFVGEMASFTTAAVRCATVKAKGNVRVKVIPGELLHDCVERIPEVRDCIFQGILPASLFRHRDCFRHSVEIPELRN